MDTADVRRSPTAPLSDLRVQRIQRACVAGRTLDVVHVEQDGNNEVFVQSFPEPGRKVQVSKGGGSHARWRNDGKELFYLAADNKLMAVAVKEGSGFEAGPPTVLFEVSGLDRNFFRYPYAVAADGQRFLLLKPVEDSASRPMTIVQNWTGMLKR